jgi:hypothetical protein
VARATGIGFSIFMTDLIRYDLLAQDALRGVVRKVLTDVAKDGLPASTISSSRSTPARRACAFPTGCARSFPKK